jgi:hypothetical protein
MPTGTGTIEEIKEQALSLDLDIGGEVPVPERLLVQEVHEPLPSLKEGEGISDTPFLERAGLALKVGSGFYNIVTGLMDEYQPEVNPDFNMWDHPELLNGLAGAERDRMLYSRSLPDAEHRLDKIHEEQGQMQELMRNGSISGMALTAIASTFADPIFYAGLLAEGASVFQITSKMTRMQKMLASGRIAGITAGVETGALAITRETIGAEDVAYSMLGGFTLGTAARAGIDKYLDSGNFTKASDAVLDKMVREATEQMDDNLAKTVNNPSDKVPSATEDSIFGAHRPDLRSELLAEQGAEEVAEGLVKELSHADAFTDTLNKAKEQGWTPDDIVNSTEFKILEKNPLMTDFVKLFKFKGDGVKFFASHILENASGVAGRQKTASVLKFMWERKHLDDVMPKFREAYTAYSKDNSTSWFSPKYWGKGRDDFNRKIRFELEQYRNASVNGTTYVSKEPVYIQEAVDSWRKNMKEIAGLAQSNGVKGFDDLVIHDGYVPLLWQGKRLAGMSDKLKGRYQSLLVRGYINAGIDDKSADTIAKAVFNRQIQKALGVDSNPGALLSKDSREFLKEMLDLNGVSKAEQEALFGRIDTTLAERGKSARAKGRVPIDLTVSDGDIQLLDIIDNDMTSLGTRYLSEISGRSALARKGITNDGAWRATVTAVLKDSQAAGSTPDELAKMREILDATYSQFIGQPVGKGIHKGARRLQELAMTSMLGTVGVAQMAESANVIASIGISNLMKYSSELKAFRSAVKNGTADDTLLGELRAHIGGMWDEHLFFRPEVRLDQAGGDTSDIFTSLDNVLAGAKEKLGYLSGMNQIKNIQQQFVAIGQANKVVKMIQEGGSDERILKRFADIGWDQKTINKIRKYVDNGTVEFQDNGSLAKLNLQKWDAKTLENFSIGMHRHSAQIIQFPMIGETAYWQHSTVGSMLSQFRSFTLLSIEKQTSRQLRFADTETATAFSFGVGLSALLYMTKAQATSIGRPDREEYLEKKMAAGAVINGAIQWSGAMGPASEIINAMAATGILPSEVGSGSIGRSGGGFNLTDQIPSLSVATKGVNLSTSLIQHITPFGEGDSVKQDINNAFSMSPWGNTAPAIALKNILHSGLDEED